MTAEEHIALLIEAAEAKERTASLARDYAAFLRRWEEVIAAADGLADAARAMMQDLTPHDVREATTYGEGFELWGKGTDAIALLDALLAYREARK